MKLSFEDSINKLNGVAACLDIIALQFSEDCSKAAAGINSAALCFLADEIKAVTDSAEIIAVELEAKTKAGIDRTNNARKSSKKNT